MAKFGIFKGSSPEPPYQTLEGDYMVLEGSTHNVYRKTPAKSSEGKKFGEVGFGEVMYEQKDKLVGGFTSNLGDTVRLIED